MSNDLWRWADPDGQQRRVRLDELRAALAGGHIAPNTPVWRSGWSAWQAAQDVPELTTSALSAANGVVPNIPPPPLAMVAVQHEFESKATGTFSQPPPAPTGGDEPPPPPAYVPRAVKSGSLPPPAPGSSGALPRIVSSLPTTIGLPPPPEMIALAAAHAARTRAGAPQDPDIEELSGSTLLEDAGPRGGPPPLLEGVLPPPTNPIVHDGDGLGADGGLGEGLDDDIAGLPSRRPSLSAIFQDLREIKAGRPPKNKLLVAVLAIVGLSVLISMVALVVSLFSGKPSEVATVTGSGSAAPAGASLEGAHSAAASNTAVLAAASAPAAKAAEPKPEPAPAGLGDCAVAGEAHVVAPRAFIQSGVEAVAFPGSIALGFAINPRDGLAVTVEPASIGITTTVRARALGGDARRMSPVLEKGKLTLVPDVDKKFDKLVGRRVVNTNPAIDVGIVEGAVVWAPHGQNSWAKLFALEGEGVVEALRAIPLASSKGIALAFRRGNAVYVGLATGDAVLTPAGALGRIAGLGQVGAPSLATSGEAVLVAWSDRATAQDPWQVRWTKLGIGDAPEAAKTLALPEGGLGVQAMSPSLAGLGGGRFAIAWSEGTPTHQVRAVTMNADGTASGAAMVLSAAGINAGQPQIAIGDGGRGVVAFLASKGKFYEVHATPVTCAAK